MNILLIHPKMTHGPVIYEDRGTVWARLFSNPELTLPAVAATIPKKYNVEIIHENFEDINYSNHFDIVGISCFTLFAKQVYEIADKFRNMGIPVVLGGYHPSALPKEAKQHADSVVIGEAEYNFPRLLKDLEKNRLKPFYYANKMVEGKDIPPLRRELLKYKFLIDGMRITRGCPYKCDFCSITYFFKHSYRKRPIKNVIKELKSLSCKHVYFHDANLTVDADYCIKLFKAMIKEKINKKWFANGNIYFLGNNEKFLDLAKQSGCIGWTTGFESILQKSLDSVNKPENRVEKYVSWIKNIKKYGMVINGLFIFGFDEDTSDVFEKTIEALNHLEVDAGEFNILTPLPGTPLFNKMEKEGRILTKDWSRYTQTEVVFQPKNMSPKELHEGTKKVVKEFFKKRNMLKRTMNLLSLKISPSSISHTIFLNIAQKKWYEREFGI